VIDAYQDGLIDRSEFEPRLHHAQDRLRNLNTQISTLVAEQDRAQDLRVVIGQLEAFAKMVDSNLDQVDWSTQRQLIRTLVKQIEIGGEVVKVVYRIDRLPFARAPEGGLLQHCSRREGAALWDATALVRSLRRTTLAILGAFDHRHPQPLLDHR
jgi:site-specific DNA recombinase